MKRGIKMVNKCYRVTAITKMGFPRGKRVVFPDRNKTFSSRQEAMKYVKNVKKANRGTYNLKMLFGNPKIESC